MKPTQPGSSFQICALAIIVTALLPGCVLFTSANDFGESWKGNSLEELSRAWGPPNEVLPLGNGESEVRYDLFKGECLYYFVVDPRGTLVSYRHVSHCFGCCKPVG